MELNQNKSKACKLELNQIFKSISILSPNTDSLDNQKPNIRLQIHLAYSLKHFTDRQSQMLPCNKDMDCANSSMCSVKKQTLEANLKCLSLCFEAFSITCLISIYFSSKSI